MWCKLSGDRSRSKQGSLGCQGHRAPPSSPFPFRGLLPAPASSCMQPTAPRPGGPSGDLTSHEAGKTATTQLLKGGSDSCGPPECEEVEGGIKPWAGCGRGCPLACPQGCPARASLRADPCQLPCPANRPVGQREARVASGSEVGGPRSLETPGGSSGLPGARSGEAEGSRGRTTFLMHLTWTLEPWHLKDPLSAGTTPGRPSAPFQVRGAMCKAHLGILAGEVGMAAALATQVSPSPHLPDRSRAQGHFPKVPGTQRFLVKWGQRARFHYKYFVVVHLLSRA